MDDYYPTEQEIIKLNALKELVTVCNAEKVNYTIVGGYGLDGLYGELTRGHHDIDIAAADGAERIKLVKLINSLGYYLERENQSKQVYKREDLGDFQVEVASMARINDLSYADVEKIFPAVLNASLDGVSFRAPTLEGEQIIQNLQNKRARERGWGPYMHAEHREKLRNLITKDFQANQS